MEVFKQSRGNSEGVTLICMPMEPSWIAFHASFLDEASSSSSRVDGTTSSSKNGESTSGRRSSPPSRHGTKGSPRCRPRRRRLRVTTGGNPSDDAASGASGSQSRHGRMSRAVQRLFRTAPRRFAQAYPLFLSTGSVPEMDVEIVDSHDSAAETPPAPPTAMIGGATGGAPPGPPPGVDFTVAEGLSEDAVVLLLQFRATTGRLTGRAFAPHPGVARAPALDERYGALRGGVAVDRPGVAAWAYVWGEAHVRVSPPVALAAPWVFGGCGGANSWRHLVDAPDSGETGSVCVGGHVEVGEDATLLRWCVRLDETADPAVVLPLAGRVPLPFERLWIVASKGDGYLEDFLGGASIPELEASGRLQVVSDHHVVLKATTVSAEVYERAKRKVKRFARARRALKAATHSPQATLASIASAQKAYNDAHVNIQANLATYLRGNEERKARRSLGILDERYSRHQNRLELLYAGTFNDNSPLAKLGLDLVDHVAGYLTMTDHEIQIASSRNATPPRARGRTSRSSSSLR